MDSSILQVVLASRWTPLKLGQKCLAWWSADRLDRLTLTSTGLVAVWRDLRFGYALEEATNRPQWAASGFAGKPGVTFNGTNTILTLASQPLPSGALPSECWAIVDQTLAAADTNPRCIFGYGGVSTLSERLMRRVVVSGVNRYQGLTGDGAANAGNAVSTVDFSGRNVCRTIYGATNTDNELNGTLASPTAAAVPATGTTRVRMGALPTTTPLQFWSGVTRDVIVTELLTVYEANLLRNWGLARTRLLQ